MATALIALVSNSATANVYYVRSTGNDSNSGTDRNSAFKSLHKALASATGNDIVYVGAGTYKGAMVKDYGKMPGSIRIFGDSGGTYTGDKGAVTVEVLPQQWGLRIMHANTLMLYNIDFVGRGSSNQANGCQVQDVANYSYFYNCKFENLAYGISSDQARYNYATLCSYTNTKYADHVRGSVMAMNFQSKYVGFSLGIQYIDVAAGYTYACSFKAATDASRKVAENYPIRAYRSGTYVVQSTFDTANYGVYGEDLTLLQVSDCQFNNPSSYAVYATGRQLTARNITVQGAGKQTGWGLMLSDKDGAKSNLTNVKISGLYGGIVATGSDYNYKQVTLNGNQVGLYFESQSSSMTIDEQSDLTLDDNYYAIHAHNQNQAKPGLLTVRGQTISNNTHGIYAQGTDLRLDNCRFFNNAYGARVTEATQVSVSNCEFRDNVAREKGSHYGLYISSARTTISGLVATNNYSGLVIENLSELEPDLRNIEIADNEYAGLWARDGALTLTDSNHITISGSRYGLYGYRTHLNLTNVSLPTGCDFPVYNFEAELRIAGGDISEGTTGISSVRSPSVSIRDVRVENQKQHGFYLYQPELVNMSECQSSRNGGNGLYCIAPVGRTIDFQVTDSTFSHNLYGFHSIGIPFDMAHAHDLTIAGNDHGLTVEGEKLWLTPEMNITLVDNGYAAMSYYGSMKIADVDISGNDYGLYTWQSKLQATGTKLANKTYGVVCYTGDSELIDVDIRDSEYGVFFSARDDQGDTLSIRNSRFENISVGIYVRSSGRTSKLHMANSQVIGGNFGILGYQSGLTVHEVTMTASQNYGIAQVYGAGVYEDLHVDGAGSWGLIAYGDSAVLDRARINSKYGVHLRTISARVLNSVIHDSVYGIYTSNVDGDFEILQSTIANISHYGVFHNAGRAVLKNSIVEAGVYALCNRSSSGSLTHDHNLLHAGLQSYVNEQPGEEEIEKQPIFLDPKAGDFHLTEGSPAINAGIDLSSITDRDLEGNVRPSFRKFEMGAFEYVQADGSLRVLEWEEKAH